jgi:hypothetical protein
VWDNVEIRFKTGDDDDIFLITQFHYLNDLKCVYTFHLYVLVSSIKTFSRFRPIYNVAADVKTLSLVIN